MKDKNLEDIHGRIHPWMRIPPIANMLAFTLGAIAIIIASFEIQASYLRTIFIVIGIIASLLFSFLFLIFLGLAIRDYRDLYPYFTRKLFGIRWLKY